MKYYIKYVCDDCEIVVTRRTISHVAFQYYCDVADGFLCDTIEVKGNVVIRYIYCSECKQQ